MEKHHGYQYEKCLAHDWNAMRGYHYLMRMGHMFNVLTQYAERLVKLVKSFWIFDISYRRLGPPDDFFFKKFLQGGKNFVTPPMPTSFLLARLGP